VQHDGLFHSDIEFVDGGLKIAIHILNRVLLKTPYELWTDRKPSVNHLRVWRSPTEAKVFNPNIGKLDPKIVSCHFIGYLEKSKGYHFYCPGRHIKIVETRHTSFLEDQMISGSKAAREINLEEKRVFVPIPMVQEPYFTLPIVVGPTAVVTTPTVISPTANSEPILQELNKPIVDEHQPQQEQPQEEEMLVAEPSGRPQRSRKSPISDDYIVYECEELQMEGEPTSFEEAMRSAEASKWQEAMEDELKSMSTNKVWDLEEIPKGAKTIGCK